MTARSNPENVQLDIAARQKAWDLLWQRLLVPSDLGPADEVIVDRHTNGVLSNNSRPQVELGHGGNGLMVEEDDL